MRTDLFDFALPDHLIALRAVQPRDAARLLVVNGGALADHHVHELPRLLEPGDCLVFNDTRVIRAAFYATRWRGDHQADVSVNLHMPVGATRWRAFARPGRKIRPGDRLFLGAAPRLREADALVAQVVAVRERGEIELAFDCAGAALMDAIEAHGMMPLPPYIARRRAVDAADDKSYQTIYGKYAGAVAAPTAGLHFTDDLMARLDERGILRVFVTLHVGGGTFLAVRGQDTDTHAMHAEWGEISAEAAAILNGVRARAGRIIAVGTTSLRLLETAWDGAGTVAPFSGETEIFITPGYRFRAIDGVLTNFHLPRSTLFMLVCALCGMDTMHQAYAHAISAGYRFYSYGDASLLLP